MSLTSQLDNSSSPIRKFLKEQFPNTRAVMREVNARIRKAETIRPREPVPWGTMGTAFDYRARYYFGVTPSSKLVAWEGALGISSTDLEWKDTDQYDFVDAEGMCYFSEGLDSAIVVLRRFQGRVQIYTGPDGLAPREGGPIPPNLVVSFFADLDETLARMAPGGHLRDLEQQDEELLARYCIALALFEEFYRSGAGQARISSPLMRHGAQSTVQDLLSIAEDHWVEDLCRLSRMFSHAFQDRLSGEAILNPKFLGSGDVGGADADIIVGTCLMEFKTTVKTSIERLRGLYQLIGYLLLDYDDEFGIEKLGFYMARQGLTIDWPVADLFGRLMGQKPPPLRDLRQEVRAKITARE